MFGIEVGLLTGRYVATAHDDRMASEWPPHPARLFSALVATWAEQEPPDPQERDALLWLEHAGHPSICATTETTRTAVTHYVPVNDTTIFRRELSEGRALKVADARQTFDEALDRADGDLAGEGVQSALTRLAKLRDVSKQVGSLDKTTIETAVALLPDRRGRQARAFPSVTPADPRVEFVWPSAEPPAGIASALDSLLARVTRLGHSSSLVSCRLTRGESRPTWVPDPDGEHTLRCVEPGQLAALEAAFARHLASRPRTMPASGVRFRATAQDTNPDRPGAPRPTLSGRWFAFEILPPRNRPMTRVTELTRVLRDAVMSHAPELPEGLTGHNDAGSPSTRAHAAFLGLPFVGRQHASGRLIGAAILLPAFSDAASEESLLEVVARAIGTWEQNRDGPCLLLGRGGRVPLRRVVGNDTLHTLRRSTWDRPSRAWVSVTPIALPRHPGDLSTGSATGRNRAWSRAEEQVRVSCLHAGMPEPVSVAVTTQPLVAGSTPARTFPVFRQFDRAQQREIGRLQVHAAVEFAEPVRGPLVLGAGRYFGLGLMLPMDGRRDDE